MITLILFLVGIILYMLLAVASIYFGLIVLMIISGIMFLTAAVRYLSLRDVPITPTCPYCGSTDIDIQAKYAGTTAGGVLSGGIGLLSTSNSYRSLATCKRCGSTFYHAGIQGKQQAKSSMSTRGIVFIIIVCLFFFFNKSMNSSSDTNSVTNTSDTQETTVVETSSNTKYENTLANDQIQGGGLSEEHKRVLNSNTFVVGGSGIIDANSESHIVFDYQGGSLNMTGDAGSVLISGLANATATISTDQLPLILGQHVYVFGGYRDESSSHNKDCKWTLMIFEDKNGDEHNPYSCVSLLVNNDDGSTTDYRIQNDENTNAVFKKIIDFYVVNMDSLDAKGVFDD